MKEKVITIIDELKNGIEKSDIPVIIHSISILNIDTKFGYSPIAEYVKTLLLESIEKAVKESPENKICVERKSAYNDIIVDVYKIENGELQRNCNPAKWAGIGKLYGAYKKIYKCETN